MTTLNEAVMGAIGHPGTYNENLFFWAGGVPPETVNGAVMRYLGENGGTGTYNERWASAIIAIGGDPSLTINELMYWFFTVMGGVFTPSFWTFYQDFTAGNPTTYEGTQAIRADTTYLTDADIVRGYAPAVPTYQLNTDIGQGADPAIAFTSLVPGLRHEQAYRNLLSSWGRDIVNDDIFWMDVVGFGDFLMHAGGMADGTGGIGSSPTTYTFSGANFGGKTVVGALQAAGVTQRCGMALCIGRYAGDGVMPNPWLRMVLTNKANQTDTIWVNCSTFDIGTVSASGRVTDLWVEKIPNFTTNNNEWATLHFSYDWAAGATDQSIFIGCSNADNSTVNAPANQTKDAPIVYWLNITKTQYPQFSGSQLKGIPQKLIDTTREREAWDVSDILPGQFWPGWEQPNPFTMLLDITPLADADDLIDLTILPDTNGDRVCGLVDASFNGNFNIAANLGPNYDTVPADYGRYQVYLNDNQVTQNPADWMSIAFVLLPKAQLGVRQRIVITSDGTTVKSYANGNLYDTVVTTGAYFSATNNHITLSAYLINAGRGFSGIYHYFGLAKTVDPDPIALSTIV